MHWLTYALMSAAAAALTLLLGEPVGARAAAGIGLMTVGALLTLR